MKRTLAGLLHRWAARLYESREEILILDDYGITRCQIIILTDDAIHNVQAKLVQLPQGWKFEEHELSR